MLDRQDHEHLRREQVHKQIHYRYIDPIQEYTSGQTFQIAERTVDE